MHSYRKANGGTWQAGFNDTDGFTPLGPTFLIECEALRRQLSQRWPLQRGDRALFRRPGPRKTMTSPTRAQGLDYEPEAARAGNRRPHRTGKPPAPVQGYRMNAPG
jgi:hypothetical protein